MFNLKIILHVLAIYCTKVFISWNHFARRLNEVEDDISELESITDSIDRDLEKGQSLWVEKYSPRHYTELLSDEVVPIVILTVFMYWSC